MKHHIRTLLSIILFSIFLSSISFAAEEAIYTDHGTGLMWARQDNGRDINWADAKAYCENYRGGNYTDWRMPTQEELKGLYDRTVTKKEGLHKTDLIKLTSCCPLTSETRGSDAAYVHFDTGSSIWCSRSSEWKNRVLPVRSVK